MKLSELRPCDSCGGPIGQCFSVVRCSQALLNAKAANEVLGTSMILGGLSAPGALQLAEVMAPAAEKAVLIFGDENPELMTELFLCFECFAIKLHLAEIVERRNR